MTVLSLVLLGTGHNITTALQNLGVSLSSRLTQITNYQLTGAHAGHNHLVSVVFARKFQLQFSDWVKGQSHRTAIIAAPDFQDIFSAMRQGLNWEPVIPPRYLVPLTPSPNLNLEANYAGYAQAPAPGEERSSRTSTQLQNKHPNPLSNRTPRRAYECKRSSKWRRRRKSAS